MRAGLHGALAAGLGCSTAFFVYLWYESGMYCGGPLIQGNPVHPCGFELELANSQFLSIGLLSVFLVAVELVMALKKQTRVQGHTFSESLWQRRLRRMGLIFILIGFMLAFYGLYALNTTMVNCPANGCDPSVLWAIYGPLEVSFFGGQLLIALGAVMVLSSEFLRIDSKKRSEEMLTK
ncbi:MAG: hypothetical protein M1587_04865 [Thaumarchaeota archaeon]|nr:hypothetical protein [Nitrososphaerota archaeon]MCL5067787.1 hypothetical protein [Nitrososphaerota archaeon]